MVNTNTIDKDEYVRFILKIVETDGLEIANTANHLGLESKRITLETFQAAAQELANIVLNRN